MSRSVGLSLPETGSADSADPGYSGTRAVSGDTGPGSAYDVVVVGRGSGGSRGLGLALGAVCLGVGEEVVAGLQELIDRPLADLEGPFGEGLFGL